MRAQPMISVETARQHLFDLIHVLPTEEVPLTEALGRVLAKDVVAGRNQPPFAASAMDGYAVRAEDAKPGARMTVIGEAAAGHAHTGPIAAGQALRIFTGAPLPNGAHRVIIQEDVTRTEDIITLSSTLEDKTHVRPAGADFSRGTALPAPARLGPAEIALIAAMGHGHVTVTRKPRIALMATGDELMPPGCAVRDDQIHASNTYGLHAMLTAAGAAPRLLPIARDTAEDLTHIFGLAAGADLIVTIGGASVGDHDLVAPVARQLGLEQRFYKIAMRPGKPLMAGRFQGIAQDLTPGSNLTGAAFVGLPGNPVSAMVCGHLFLRPMVDAMLGLPAVAPPLKTAPLGAAIGPNGPREHYMRAQITHGQITAAPRQDSALLSVLASANALLIRPPHDPARGIGETVTYLEI